MATKVLAILWQPGDLIKMVSNPREIKEASSYKSFYNIDLPQTTNTFFNNKSDSYSTDSQESVGGKDQEWKQILENISQKNVKHLKPKYRGAGMVKRTYDYKRHLNIERSKNPYLLHPVEYETQEQLFDAMKHWWIFKYRKKETTITDRLRYAKKMSKHPIYPINWLEFNPIQIINYLEHREYVDYNNIRGKHQIINEWKTVKTFARAFGIDPNLWGYTPPSPPKAKVKQIPLPPTVHKLLHSKYSNNKYENALVTHILTHSFHLGWRPSELIVQNVNDVYLNEGYLIITETKKNNQPRQIWPDKKVITGRQKKSLKNYIECWRPQVVNQHSKDYLYLQKNGNPFKTTQHLRKYLKNYIKGSYPEFHPYIWRHWCAIARLIRSKIETKHWDIWDVKEWMGHEKIDTTEDYVKFAKQYYRHSPYDWISAVLKYYKTNPDFIEQQNDTSKIGENRVRKKKAGRVRSFSRWRKCSRRRLYLFSPVEIFEKKPRNNLYDLINSLTKSFFSFFVKYFLF